MEMHRAQAKGSSSPVKKLEPEGESSSKNERGVEVKIGEMEAEKEEPLEEEELDPRIQVRTIIFFFVK